MLAFLLAVALTSHTPVVPTNPPGANGDITGVIRDSTSGQPLTGGDVLVLRNGQVVARTETDTYGRYRIHNLPAGEYDVEVRLLGFRPTRTHVTIGPEGGDTEVSLGLAPSAVHLQELEITAPVPIAVDTRSGNQVFQQDSYHGAPTQTTS